MKTIIQLILLALLLTFQCKAQNSAPTEEIRELEIQATPDLWELAEKWTSSFNADHKNYQVNVKLLSASDQKTTFALINENKASALSDNYWRMVVGRQIVVPVTSVNNKNIAENGISLADLSKKVSDGTILISNNIIQQEITNEWLANSRQQAQAKELLLQKLRQSPNTICLLNLSEVMDLENGNLFSDISLVPIDINENGKIDFNENFYSDVNRFQRSVWMGKYPHQLYQNIFAFAVNEPTGEVEKNFIKYLITDGQQLLADNGISALVANEIPSKMSKLSPVVVVNDVIAEPKDLGRFTIMYVLIGIAIIVLALMLLNRRAQKIHIQSENTIITSGYNAQSNADFPGGMYFDRSYTWVFRERNGQLRIGVDNLLFQLTGSISKVILKNENQSIDKGDELLVLIKEGKKLSIKSPVSGIVKAYNPRITSDTNVLNDSPYDAGWVYLIEPINWKQEIKFLEIAENYKLWVKKEIIKVKDFLARAFNQKQTATIFQDGGELNNHVLSDLEPRIWEDFQNEFLDI